VVKVGGSLALYPEKLRALCAKLSEISAKHKLIVAPGGGEFADVVRGVDKRFNLSPAASHRMAILGMDQYGFLLSDLMPCSCVVNQLENVQKVLDSGKLPVFLPSNLLLSEDPLQNSWDVTSDSITVYIAGQLHISKVLLVTDVDGVYTCDPKKHSDAKLIKRLSAKELLMMNKRTSVDKFLPKLLLQLQIECFVVNGLYPERVEAVLVGQDTVCTLIK
ncbi:MAG: delta 1-pyrroline-5-carboxylate synthetase, partial [Candidatus Bathyarchaeota archaeon]|nr:delta 1-pyrroline-5-carboxylate synthetase [Candidatus Bathyarchaeota archaeon]